MILLYRRYNINSNANNEWLRLKKAYAATKYKIILIPASSNKITLKKNNS